MSSQGLGEAFEPILAAARTEEAWAFRSLFEWLGRPIAGYLRGAGLEDPDGTANEVFLRIFGAIDRFEGTEVRFRSWAFSIAHNLVIDERRRRSRRPRTAPVEAAPEPAVEGAEDTALVGLGDENVRQLLACLAPDQRDVVLLRIVADLSIEDTAAALGKSPGAVKALQHRAIAALRRQEAVSR